jgi:methanogenic corrinoid protein MtbC1
MYTIKQAAARTGISVPVLRAWERRYGVVRPGRTASGYRMYDEAALTRLRAMRHLVDQGWARGAAAAELGRLDDAAIATLAAAAPQPVPPTESGAVDLVARFVDAAAARDTRAVDTVLDDMLALGTFESVAERYLLPALVELGTAWESGRIDVAAEHAASHAALRRLSAAYEAAGNRPARGGPVVVGLPPGSRHELGALAFSVAARRAGLVVLYEGADLPAEEWLNVVTSTNARAAVIGVVTAADRAAANDVARLLRAERPSLLIALGGRAATDGASNDRTIRLSDGMRAAVDDLRSALR